MSFRLQKYIFMQTYAIIIQLVMWTKGILFYQPIHSAC